MTASVTPFAGRFGDSTGPAVRLAVGSAEADVLPFLGFNCVRWVVGDEPILYTEPPGVPNPSPTRSGHPILFPFPNRIRDGRFTFDGREYVLPPNDATKSHAIHGFTPRNPWRVTDSGTAAGTAFVTGEFHLSRDLPESRKIWPADFVLNLTYRLADQALRVEAVVSNPDTTPLPFGLGYHAYFCPIVRSEQRRSNTPIDDTVLHVGTNRVWQSVDLLPTGQITRVPESLDFTTPHPIGPTQFDHVFTDLSNLRTGSGLKTLAILSNPGCGSKLLIRADESFRELVLFTPTHRNAIAIEPYTCATDAANLGTRGIPAGWRVLPSGEQFIAGVEYRLEAES